MPYQVLPEQQRKRQPLDIAAPPQPSAVGQIGNGVARGAKNAASPVRQFGDAAYQTARGIAGAVGSMTVGPAVDIGRGAVSLLTGNDPRSRPGGAMATTQMYLDQAKDAEQKVFGGTGQAIQQFGGELTGTKPFTPVQSPPKPAAAPATSPAPTTKTGLPNDPREAGAPQSIAAAVPATAPRAGLDVRAENQAFLAQRARDRDANLARRDAQIDASIANANRTGLRNNLISQLNRTKPTSNRELQRGYKRYPQEDARAQLIAQIAALEAPVAAAKTPSVLEQQKGAAEVDAALTKGKADALGIEASQLALQGAQRQNAVQQQIADLQSTDTPDARALYDKALIMAGKDPYAERFQSVEDIAGTDAYGTPIKTRSLYDTRTGSFIDRGTSAGGKPSQADALSDAKAAVKNGANKDAVNARLKQFGYPTI